MAEQKFQEALSRCGGDQDLLRMTARMIAADAPGELHNLATALDNGNASAARSHAHALRGMCSTFVSSVNAINGLQAVEDSCKSGGIERAKLHLSNCRGSVESLLADIQTFSES